MPLARRRHQAAQAYRWRGSTATGQGFAKSLGANQPLGQVGLSLENSTTKTTDARCGTSEALEAPHGRGKKTNGRRRKFNSAVVAAAAAAILNTPFGTGVLARSRPLPLLLLAMWPRLSRWQAARMTGRYGTLHEASRQAGTIPEIIKIRSDNMTEERTDGERGNS